MRRHQVVFVTAVCLCLFQGSLVRAEPAPYRGPHPIDLDGHWHDDSSVHVHNQLGLEGFSNVDGVWLFLGDPATYAYSGSTWTYAGAHPLPFGMTGYCGMDGTHRHPFFPEGEYTRRANGSYAFASPMRGGWQSYRPSGTQQPVVVADSATALRPYPSSFTPWCQTILGIDGTVTYGSPEGHCTLPPSPVVAFVPPHREEPPAPPTPSPVVRSEVSQVPRLAPNRLPRNRLIEPGPVL